ncbi:MAG: hypothetical protein ACYS91_15335 [Planctomycetota bacterium]|jgi:hypothetical protein
MIWSKGIPVILLFFVAAFSLPAVAEEESEGADDSFFGILPIEMHGFYEIRSGYRTRKDKYQKDMSVMETRLQVDLSSYPEWGDLKVKGDVFGDLVEEQGDFDLREAYIFNQPLDFMDLKVGRQILTWGTAGIPNI